MDGLKQRIVGALVIISMAVIFLPMLFDEPREDRISKPVDIPEEPAFPAVSEDAAPVSEVPVQEEPAPAMADNPDDSPGYQFEERSDQEPTTTSEDVASTGTESTAAVEESDDAEVSETQSQPEPESPGDDSEPASFSDVMEDAWLVQLGSFGKRQNAIGLRDQVREKGYDAHLQTVEGDGTTMTRVFSGPFASRSTAEEAKSSLDEAFSVNSLIVQGDQ